MLNNFAANGMRRFALPVVTVTQTTADDCKKRKELELVCPNGKLSLKLPPGLSDFFKVYSVTRFTYIHTYEYL